MFPDMLNSDLLGIWECQKFRPAGISSGRPVDGRTAGKLIPAGRSFEKVNSGRPDFFPANLISFRPAGTSSGQPQLFPAGRIFFRPAHLLFRPAPMPSQCLAIRTLRFFRPAGENSGRRPGFITAGRKKLRPPATNFFSIEPKPY